MGLTVEEYHKKYGMDKDKLSWLKIVKSVKMEARTL